jgi:hypothetical protein
MSEDGGSGCGAGQRHGDDASSGALEAPGGSSLGSGSSEEAGPMQTDRESPGAANGFHAFALGNGNGGSGASEEVVRFECRLFKLREGEYAIDVQVRVVSCFVVLCCCALCVTCVLCCVVVRCDMTCVLRATQIAGVRPFHTFTILPHCWHNSHALLARTQRLEGAPLVFLDVAASVLASVNGAAI